MIIYLINIILIAVPILFLIFFIKPLSTSKTRYAGGWKVVFGAILLIISGVIGLFNKSESNLYIGLSNFDILQVGFICFGFLVLFYGIREFFVSNDANLERVNVRLRKLTALKSITEASIESLTLVEILNHSLDRILNYMKLSGGCIHIFNPNNNSFIMGTFMGLPLLLARELEAIPPENEITVKLAAGQPTSIPGAFLNKDSIFSDSGYVQYTSGYSFPLMDDRELIGSITLFSSRSNFFTTSQIDGIKECVRILTSVLVKAKQVRSLKKQLTILTNKTEHLSCLLKINSSIPAIIANNSKINVLFSKIKNLLPPCSVSLVSINLENQSFKLIASSDVIIEEQIVSGSAVKDYYNRLASFGNRHMTDSETLNSIWPEELKQTIYDSRAMNIRWAMVISSNTITKETYYLIIEGTSKQTIDNETYSGLVSVFSALISILDLKIKLHLSESERIRYLEIMEKGWELLNLENNEDADKRLAEIVFDLDSRFQGVYILTRDAIGINGSLTGYCDPSKKSVIKDYTSVLGVKEVFEEMKIITSENIPENLFSAIGSPDSLLVIPYSNRQQSLLIANYSDDNFKPEDNDYFSSLLKFAEFAFEMSYLDDRTIPQSIKGVPSGLLDDFSGLLNNIMSNSQQILEKIDDGAKTEGEVNGRGLKVWLKAIERATSEGTGILKRIRGFADKGNMSNSKGIEHPLKVLIIDDNTELLSTSELMFAALGHKPVTASDAMQALDILAVDNDFDMILTDLGLPGMDGWELIRQVRKNNFSKPIVIMTGLDTESDEMFFTQYKVLNKMSKPFDLSDVSGIIDQVNEQLKNELKDEA
ncbi:MAG: response regulator [candidate division Zixibacteria bacterium]|nr:response regulator [candidate division Zixibacteria bacterium]